MTLALGAIADDFTGGTDVAVALRRAGMRTLIFFGQPPADADVPASDAIVVALKTRMIDSTEAVRQSLSALDWLRGQGATRHYFKYCSTFDSTPSGNIGPVLDALSEALGESTVVTTPSSPQHGRTQYQGHLFVGPLLLSESPMRDHPLTPMTDSNLPNLLAAQSRRTVGLIPLQVVRAGVDTLREALSRSGEGHLLVDAIDDADLVTIATAALDARLTAGAAGLAGGLAFALGAAGQRTGEEPGNADPVDAVRKDRASSPGRAAVLSGSCSTRTLEQVDRFRAERPAYRLDALAQSDPDALAEAALRWYDSLPADTTPLIYSSLEPQQLKQVQDQLGVARSAEILETAIGRVARGLVERGVTRVVAAGGETSGSIVTALGVNGGLIGAEEAPGVPWIHTTSGLDLLLKSGNFGEPDLLLKASA